MGYDPYTARVESLNTGIDTTGEIGSETLKERLATHLICTANPNDAKDCNVYIVAVPTPIDLYQQPDLTALREASQTVGALLKKGDIVIYESTVYPGVTEEVCVPILESVSGLHTTAISLWVTRPSASTLVISTIPWRLSARLPQALPPEVAQEIDTLYNSVLRGGTYPCPVYKSSRSRQK